MQDSKVSRVKVPLKNLLNLVLSDTHQHQVHFWSRFGYICVKICRLIVLISLVCEPQSVAAHPLNNPHCVLKIHS